MIANKLNFFFTFDFLIFFVRSGSYIGITKTNYRTQVANNATVRDTILISAGDGDPITSTSSCFNGNFQCR